MKNINTSIRKLLLSITVIFCSLNVHAQVPQALTYQAVARNAAGSAIINSNISIRISIKDVNATGPTLYSETQSVTTNQFGLFTLSVGTGLIQSGVFSTINWAVGSKFMKVEMDPAGGSGYIDMGTSQLLSVPYALMAGSLVGGAGGDDWGTQTANTNTTLSGNGTSVTPLGIAQQGASTGQVLKWNGTTWAPATDLMGSNGGDNWGTQTVITSSNLSGGGTFTSPLTLAQQGAVSGQTLKWNGATWAPANDVDNDAQTLNFIGNTLTISNGNSVTLPAQINYAAGAGINIAGNTITNTGDLSNTNELQTLSIAGNQLSISNGNSVAIPTTNYTGGSGINVTGNIISNTSPDQVVTVTGTGSATVGGVYPNFTINATDAQTLSLSGTNITITNGNTITLPVQTPYLAGTGIGITGTTITNTSPDQIVSLTGAGGTSVTGAYPNFTINSTDLDAQTLSLAGTTISISNGNSVTLPAQLNYTAGTGIGIAGTVITNSAPDQTVTLIGTGASTVTGAYPNFTVNSTDTDTDAQTLTIAGTNLSISNGNSVTLPAQLNYTAGTGIGIAGTVITNSAPDQTVTLIGTGASTVTGAYPNFTVNSTDTDTDAQTISLSGNDLTISNGNTVTLPTGSTYTAGTGIGIVGTVITNSAPDQIVTLAGTGGATVTGAYPNFTINSTDVDAQTISLAGNILSISNGNNVTLPTGATYTAGTGIGIAGTVITNSAPDQIVTLAGTGGATVTGAYPNFTVNSTDVDAQTISLAGNILSISNGNNVTLPTGATYTAGSGINLTGTVFSNNAITDATLIGNGTVGTPLKVAQQGATNGQTLKWNGVTWLPAADIDAQTLSIAGNILSLTNGGSVTLPTGATYTAGSGINLTGTVFSNNAITDATLIGNGTVGTPLKVAQQGATNGQTLKWNGATWLPAADNDAQTLSIAGNTLSLTNGGSVTLPAGTIYTAGFGIGIVGNVITNTSPSTNYTAGSGLSLAGTTFSNNAITDATLSGNGTAGTPLKIAQQGATNGQVLQWNGTSWIPATMSAGGTLGQIATTVYGTAPITINTTPVQPFLIPGLTQTINVPAGYTAYISTDGGMQGSGTFNPQFSIVDIQIFDGLVGIWTTTGGGGYERLYAAYNGYFLGPFNYWNLSLSAALTPGIHTITVQAQFVTGGLGCVVSGDVTSVLQGQLTVVLIKN